MNYIVLGICVTKKGSECILFLLVPYLVFHFNSRPNKIPSSLRFLMQSNCISSNLLFVSFQKVSSALFMLTIRINSKSEITMAVGICWKFMYFLLKKKRRKEMVKKKCFIFFRRMTNEKNILSLTKPDDLYWMPFATFLLSLVILSIHSMWICISILFMKRFAIVNGTINFFWFITVCKISFNLAKNAKT